MYQDLDDLVAACQHDDAQVTEFDTSCFSGEYVTGDITPGISPSACRASGRTRPRRLRREGRSPLQGGPKS